MVWMKERFIESADLFKNLSENKEISDKFDKSVNVILSALKSGNKILIAGNGGSAADSIHFAAEMVGRFYFDRPALPCIALVSNISNLTCIGNDYSFDDIFSRQVEGLGNKGDIFIGISTSGNSENVIKAVKVSKEKGITTIGLTGKSGGRLKNEVEININIPYDKTPLVQEAHITILHSIAEQVEKLYFE